MSLVLRYSNAPLYTYDLVIPHILSDHKSLKAKLFRRYSGVTITSSVRIGVYIGRGRGLRRGVSLFSSSCQNCQAKLDQGDSSSLFLKTLVAMNAKCST